MSLSSNRSIIRSMLAACSGILGSRIFGLARDICMAWYWGATGVAQAAFNVAFAIPNSLRSLFGEGAFTSAFVPMITERLTVNKQEDAWKLANRSITVQAAFLLLCVIAFSIGSIAVYWFGEERLSETGRLTCLILPILMPYSLLICLTGAFGAILNSLKKFAAPSLIPVIFNVVQISAVCGLALCAMTNIRLASLIIFCNSALLAGILQLLFMYFLCVKSGYSYHPDFHWNTPEVKMLGVKILPGILGAGVMQINSLIDKFLGIYLGPEAVGALNYSQHLVYLPVGIFGVAMGIVCLPALTAARAENDQEKMKSSLDFALNTVLFLALPCAALLFALGKPVLGLLFARGAFNDVALNNCFFALAFYLVGLPAFCCAKVATTPFHARLDTRTPVKIAIFCMLLNLCLNLILMQFLKQGGLALSTSICSWLNVGLLLFLNRKFLSGWSPRPFLSAAAALIPASFFAGIAAWAVNAFLTQRLDFIPPFYCRAIIVVTGGLCGLAIYLIACKCLKRPELVVILKGLTKRKNIEK